MLKQKTKESLVDLIKETSRNSKNNFIRIFPTQLYPIYEKYLQNSPNLIVYKQVHHFLYNNKYLNNKFQSKGNDILGSKSISGNKSSQNSFIGGVDTES